MWCVAVVLRVSVVMDPQVVRRMWVDVVVLTVGVIDMVSMVTGSSLLWPRLLRTKLMRL